MIRKEYQIWLSLGGEIRGDEIIADLIQQLRETEAYKGLPPGKHTEDILIHAALTILASDHAHLYTILHTAKTAVDDKDLAKVKVIIEKAFLK